ncbi:O-antigen ligase family protein [Candidatus Daviesbacteria bacterium]|nr:O-antigen ligase family protein [Candidatus Daviesbacteria bacterium]
MLKLKRVEQILLFLTILFLPTQLGKHFWPTFSFIYSLPIDYLSPTFYFWDLLVVGLCLTFIWQKKHINRLAMNLLYLFIFTQAISLLGNGVNTGVGFVRLEQYLIAGFFGVYIASSKLADIRLIVFLGLVLSITGEALLAIFQFLKGGTIGFWILGERTFSLSTPGIAKFDFYGSHFLRPYATFPHPNTLAGFLIIATLILTCMKTAKSGVIATISKVATFLGGLAILLTVSRVAILVSVISVMVLVKKKGRVLLLILIIVLLPILYTRFSSVFNFDNLTLIRREELSQVAFNLWLKSPLLGVGLNNFIPAASDLLLTGPSRFLQPVHNIFLLSLSETGLLGLLGLLTLLGYPIFKLSRLFKPYILLAWVVFIFLGMFDHYFLTLPQGYRLLFLLWGLSISMLE